MLLFVKVYVPAVVLLAGSSTSGALIVSMTLLLVVSPLTVIDPPLVSSNELPPAEPMK